MVFITPGRGFPVVFIIGKFQWPVSWKLRSECTRDFGREPVVSKAMRMQIMVNEIHQLNTKIWRLSFALSVGLHAAWNTVVYRGWRPTSITGVGPHPTGHRQFLLRSTRIWQKQNQLACSSGSTPIAAVFRQIWKTQKYIDFSESKKYGQYWNGNVAVLTKFWSLPAQEDVKMSSSSAADDENFVKMTIFPCLSAQHIAIVV